MLVGGILALTGWRTDAEACEKEASPETIAMQGAEMEKSKKTVAGEPRCFEAFLAYRRAASAADVSYYEEVGPGRYRLVGGSPLAVEAPEQIFTREELMEKHDLSSC